MTDHVERRAASAGLLAAAFAAYSLAHLANNTLLAREAPSRVLEELETASGGWIAPVLVRSQVVLAAFLLVVIVLGGRSLADVGWRARKVVPGLFVFAGAWLALQLVLAGAAVAQGRALALHPLWARAGASGVLGGVLAQAFGHALAEDTAFRGFFLPELRAHGMRAGRVLALPAALVLALFGSAVLFGLAHLPTLALVKGSTLARLVSEQGHFLSAGLALGVAALATRNLFAVVGLHVLLNDPAPLVDAPAELLHRAVLAVFGLTVVVCGIVRLRSWGRALRGSAPEAEREARRAA